jgi:hypothetical protein
MSIPRSLQTTEAKLHWKFPPCMNSAAKIAVKRGKVQTVGTPLRLYRGILICSWRGERVAAQFKM